MQYNDFADLLNALSLIIGLQNLQENREQSAHNDIQIANEKQAQQLLHDIHNMFEEQNVLLNEILEILHRLELKNERTGE